VHQLLASNQRGASAAAAAARAQGGVSQFQPVKLTLLSFDRSYAEVMLAPELDALARSSHGCFHILRSYGDSNEEPPEAQMLRYGRKMEVPSPSFRGRITSDMLLTALQRITDEVDAPYTARDMAPVPEDSPQETEGADKYPQHPPYSSSPTAAGGASTVHADSRHPSSTDTSRRLHSRNPLPSASNSPPSTASPLSPTLVNVRPATREVERRPALFIAPPPLAALGNTAVLPRVFICGPLDFCRSALGALDELRYDMKLVDCL
jgi:hypothetical protein